MIRTLKDLVTFKGASDWGSLLTGIHLGAAGIYLMACWADFQELAPNEWGDFLAGIFGPVAFLWLVLGYLQQGEELRQNGKALRMQANELANSVQQHKELVSATQQQVSTTAQALELEREREREKRRPKFRFSEMNYGDQGIEITFTVTIADAYKVTINPISDQTITYPKEPYAYLPTDSPFYFSFQPRNDTPEGRYMFDIEASDEFGNITIQKFALRCFNQNFWSIDTINQ